jgi:hypothetical protein
MQAQQVNAQPQTQPQEAAPRRAWERPVLQRLHVSLDTALGGGSGADGGLITPT